MNNLKAIFKHFNGFLCKTVPCQLISPRNIKSNNNSNLTDEISLCCYIKVMSLKICIKTAFKQ